MEEYTASFFRDSGLKQRKMKGNVEGKRRIKGQAKEKLNLSMKAKKKKRQRQRQKKGCRKKIRKSGGGEATGGREESRHCVP